MNDQVWQWQAGRYYRGYWFDTLRFDAKPIKVPALVNTYAEQVNAIFNEEIVNGDTKNIIWTNSWKIYEDSTLRFTIAWTSKQGYNIWFMKPSGWTTYKLYYFHFTIPVNTKSIHRSNIDGTSFDEDYRTYVSTDGNSFYTPPVQPSGMIIKNEWSRILFSYYNTIWEINNLEVVTKLITFPSEQNVVGITEFQGSYKVYTTSAFSSSRIYTWDGLDSLPILSISLQWLAITWWVQNLWAYDYFIWDDSLYQVAWVQYQKLYDKIGGRLLLWYDDRLVIELLDYLGNYFLSEYDVNPWYNRGLHPRYLIDFANQSGEIKAITYNSLGLVFSSNTKLLNSYSSTLWQTWSVDAYLESLTFIGDNIQWRKTITSITCKFSWFTTNNISLFVEIDASGTWIKLWEWNNTSVATDNMGVNIFPNMFLNPVWNFNTIRFKVVCTHTWNPQWSFYWIDLFGNQEVWV